MKRNSKKLKIFFIVSIVEMLIVAIFMGYIVYKIVSVSKTLHRETAVLQQKTELATIANDLENEKAKTEEKINALKGRVFTDESFMNFLQNLDDISGSYGLTVEHISFGQLTPAADVNPPVMLLPVSVSITGESYEGVVKFLHYLEKQGYAIKPNTISMTISPSRNSSSLKQAGSNVNISFSVYVETQSKEKWSYGGT